MISLIRKKIFWLLILLVSIFVALYVVFIYDSVYDKINRSQLEQVCFDGKNSRTTLISIDIEEDIISYLKLVENKTNKVEFAGGSVLRDQKVYVYEKHKIYPISRIFAVRDNNTLGKPLVLEYWIWNGYLKPCQM